MRLLVVAESLWFVYLMQYSGFDLLRQVRFQERELTIWGMI
jgi:hypothetical protein